MTDIETVVNGLNDIGGFIEAFGVKEMTVMNVRCSVCGSEEDVSFTGYKYCPRCGAKMEGR